MSILHVTEEMFLFFFFFTSEKHRNYTLFSCQKVCEALTSLLDNIYIRFGTKTNCGLSDGYDLRTACG